MELSILLVNLVAILAMITGIAIGIWWVIGLYAMPSREYEQELEEEDLPAHLHETLFGIPPALIIFFIFIFIYSIAYVIYIWAGGLNY